MSQPEIRLMHNGDHVSVSRSDNLRSLQVPPAVFDDGRRFEETMEKYRLGDLSFLQEPEWAELNRRVVNDLKNIPGIR